MTHNVPQDDTHDPQVGVAAADDLVQEYVHAWGQHAYHVEVDVLVRSLRERLTTVEAALSQRDAVIAALQEAHDLYFDLSPDDFELPPGDTWYYHGAFRAALKTEETTP